MFDPQHPGEIIREDCLVALDLSVTEATKGLGVTRKTLSSILNRRSGINGGNGAAAVPGVREHAGAMVADAAGLRSVAREAPLQKAAPQAVLRHGTGRSGRQDLNLPYGCGAQHRKSS
jgi:hypothetical protein